MYANEIAAPELIKTLNLFPACTVTVGQSEIRPIVYWVFVGCPPHSFSSLLGKVPSSLEVQTCCLNLRKNLTGSPR